METVMKKLIFILLASLTFLLSCDPHNTENSLTLCLDNETVNKLLSISAARSADPYEGNNYCIYAILRGSAGTTYEKTLYLNQDAANHQLYEKGITFDLSGVSFRENYDLLVYVVLNGESQYYGSRPNLELNKYGPTYVDINLNYTQWMANVPFININALNSNPTGGYNLNTIDPWSNEKTTLYSFDKNARIEIEVSMINDGNEYSYKTYVLHNGKETVLSLTEYDEYDYLLSYDYTITSPGDYTIACRATDSTGAFHTEYTYLEFVSNAINTNYVIYDNNYGTINVWETESLNESGILSTSANYDNTSANNFDFCLTSDSDIFVTDGNTVFKNWDKNNTNNNISANGRTLKSLSFDMKRNFIIACASNPTSGKEQIGIANVYSPVYSGFSWEDDPKDGTNLKLQYAAAYDGIAYLFYTETDTSNSPAVHTLYIFAYYLNEKSGQYTPPEDDYPFKAYKVCYFTYNSEWGYYPSFSINDAVVVNGNLYFLANCFSSSIFYNLSCDFGFTGKINISTNQISITGHNCTSKPVNDNNYYNTTCFDFTNYLDYYGKNTNTLKACINPQKIIAIKPKSLILSDDGKVYWDYYDPDDADPTIKFKNLNRVLTVNLDNFSVDSATVLNNITWKEEKTSINAESGTFIYTPN